MPGCTVNACIAARSSCYRLPRIASLHMAAGSPKSRMHPPHHSHDPELAPGCSSMDSETQVYRTSENRTVMQARKSLWRQLLGVTYALTVVFTPERVS
jgi:hypothetical protein